MLVVGAVSAAIWLSAMSDDAAAPSLPTATPSAAPPPSPQDQAQASLDEWLTRCAESSGDRLPEHCGIRIPWGTEFASITDVRFRIDALPVLAMDGETFTATGGVLVATVSGTGHDGSTRKETYRTEDWSVRGDLIVTDEVVTVEVW